MPETSLKLYSSLVLSFLSIVMPIIIILLSLFSEGIRKLAERYETEKKQMEDHLIEQMSKLKDKDISNLKNLEDSIKNIKKHKRTANKKLSLLNPRARMLYLLILVLISYISIMGYFLIDPSYFWLSASILILSVLTFALAIIDTGKLIHIIVEVKRILDDEAKSKDQKMLELLSTIAAIQGKDDKLFLKDVYISVEETNIKTDDVSISMITNQKQSLKISVQNIEDRMAKNVEAGFIFPISFVIEKGQGYTSYNYGQGQIIRYTYDYIHAKTNQLCAPLSLTALQSGEHVIKTFIKAENVRSIYRNLTIKVS